VAGGRAEALPTVDEMDAADAFMWLHFTRKQHEAEVAAMKRRR